nr:MAG TPA: hypothetical protein [Caudoviricetes sp.]
MTRSNPESRIDYYAWCGLTAYPGSMAGLAHRSFSSGLFHFRREVCILPACAFRWRSFEMEFKVTVRAGLFATP